MQNLDYNREFIPVNISILTISDTRVLEDDKSGKYLQKSITTAGHICKERKIVKDDVDLILNVFNAWIKKEDIDAIITTGGTGITGRDVTPEAMDKIQDKYIPGFGEVFRQISYGKIGSSTIQSRANACIARGKFIFSLPGSPGACKDAWENILLYQLDNRNRPCNLVELMPRLLER
ncbi:MAG: molybdenum cofactor biosynthesis protein B [Rickettsiales bacterium]|nr:molybdenum cofactor biosynthesis protein B [Rickettsiales bacterium]